MSHRAGCACAGSARAVWQRVSAAAGVQGGADDGPTWGWRARRSTAGMRKASVLPVPVFALASTSLLTCTRAEGRARKSWGRDRPRTLAAQRTRVLCASTAAVRRLCWRCVRSGSGRRAGGGGRPCCPASSRALQRDGDGLLLHLGHVGVAKHLGWLGVCSCAHAWWQGFESVAHAWGRGARGFMLRAWRGPLRGASAAWRRHGTRGARMPRAARAARAVRARGPHGTRMACSPTWSMACSVDGCSGRSANAACVSTEFATRCCCCWGGRATACCAAGGAP